MTFLDEIPNDFVDLSFSNSSSVNADVSVEINALKVFEWIKNIERDDTEMIVHEVNIFQPWVELKQAAVERNESVAIKINLLEFRERLQVVLRN